MSIVNEDKIFNHIIDQVYSILKQNRLAHGVLIKNSDNISMKEVLNKVAFMLLRVIDRNDRNNLENHPDIYYIKSNGDQIKVDVIRELLKKIYLTSHGGKARIVIIEPLEALNKSAANALLKVLEEPPIGVYFITTANQLEWVTPTLRSRLQVFNLSLTLEKKKAYIKKKHNMNESDANKALVISDMNIGVISRIKMDRQIWKLRKELIKVICGELTPLELTIDIDTYYSDYIYWLISFLTDTYYYYLDALHPQKIGDQKILIKNLTNRYDHITLYKLYKSLLKLREYDKKYVNVNKRLALESFLVELCSS